MSAKENFSQAIKELMGNEPSKPRPSVTPQAAPTAEVKPKTSAAPQPAGHRSVTVLASDTVIVGEVHTGGDLKLEGSVKGDVFVHGDVFASGRVVGNVTGTCLSLNGCSVKGDVTSSSQLTMDGNALVLGCIHAQNAVLGGKIKGDLRVEDNTTLNPSAVVLGDIYSGTINMATDARVQGELHITKMESLDTAFKDSDFDITV